MKRIDLAGRHFGDWQVVSRAPNRGPVAVWNCLCICGATREVLAGSLLSGKSSGCSCRQHIETAKRLHVHGHCPRGKKSPTFQSWQSMLRRCSNPEHKDWKYYGGRGIKVCERWHKFENFLADMGEKPNGLTIDRYPNNDGNYELTNCRWATRAQQQETKRCNFVPGMKGLSGEQSPSAKLTAQQVAEIRNSSDQVTQRELSHRYGVCQSNISQILSGLTWR